MKLLNTFFAFFLVHSTAEMFATVQQPSEREDVMGKYWFMNRYQCERLCWYRKLCKTYSYIYNMTLATDGNCVLHADNIPTNTTSAVSTAWIEREAFWDVTLQDNGCRNRPCNEPEVCVPTYASPFYTCLPFSTECQAPSRDDGVYSDVTLLQGQRTNFTCNSSLVWAPRHANKTVTCQVTGKYSELKGTCKHTTYYSPSVTFNKQLPDVVSEGWEACIKGNFTTTGDKLTRMDFTFHDSEYTSLDLNSTYGGNIYLSIDFRNDFDNIQKKVFWYTALRSWSAGHDLGPLPLHHNEYFEITLRIDVHNTMEIIYRNHTTQYINLTSNNINLTRATYLEISRDVKLTYVNLAKGCE